MKKLRNLAFMSALTLSASAMAAGPAPTNAVDRLAVMNAVDGALHAFSAGDMTNFRAAWADRDVEIVDDVAPYVWTGADSLNRWLAETGAEVAKLKLTNMSLVAKSPQRLDVVGDHAYLVLPVVVSYVKLGVAMRQDGVQTIVLDRKGRGWVMRVMAYAGGHALPVKR